MCVQVEARSDPVAILRSEFHGPEEDGDKRWSYSYEAENGINQQAEGTLRRVGEADVYVMSGSYSYVGPDGLAYVVDWYADETGFHPQAPHLPRSVEPNHPEVKAAVDAQLRFAEQQAENLVEEEEEEEDRFLDVLAAPGPLLPIFAPSNVREEVVAPSSSYRVALGDGEEAGEDPDVEAAAAGPLDTVGDPTGASQV